MPKRGILAIRAIVIAAMLLIVLIIIIFVFRERIFSFAETFESCEFRGGHCANVCEINEASIENTNCPKLCCVSFIEEKEEEKRIVSKIDQPMDYVDHSIK